MENKNTIKKAIIIVVIIIFLLIVAGVLALVTIPKMKQNKIKEYLTKNEYKLTDDNIYLKQTQENTDTTKYKYDIKNNYFSKYITNNRDNYQETVSINYKNDNIDIYYSYNEIGGCKLIQEGTYKDDNFKCNVISKNNNCNIKCDTMLEYTKEFKKEYENIIK